MTWTCVLRCLRRWWFVFVIGIGLLIFVAGATRWAVGQAQDRQVFEREAVQSRQTISAQQRRVIECQSPTDNDPVQHTCFEKNQVRLGVIIAQLALEVGIEGDCRNRRQVVGLTAPDPMQPCAAQTPPEVYPGG